MKRSIIFSVLFLLAGTLFSVSDAKAYRVEMLKGVEPKGDFDLGPTSIGIEVSPGQIITKTLQLTNRRGKEQKFNIEIEDFQGSLDDPTQTVVLQGEKVGKYSAKNWVTTELSEFTTQHGERLFFDVTIKVPEIADPGDHYVSVLASAPPDKGKGDLGEGQNVLITSRVGALFFIKVKGDIKEEGALQSFQNRKKFYDDNMGKNWYDFETTVPMRLLFQNTGSVRIRPSGKIEVKDWFGRKAGEVNILPFNMLRESSRYIEQNWHPTGFLFGKYTATLTLNRGYGNLSDTKSVTFWVIQWKKLLAGLLALVALILLVKILFKKVSFRVQLKK